MAITAKYIEQLHEYASGVMGQADQEEVPQMVEVAHQGAEEEAEIIVSLQTLVVAEAVAEPIHMAKFWYM